jgi:hypothetical protein
MPALRAKASALFGTAAELSTYVKSRASMMPLATLAPSAIPELALHEQTVKRFLQPLEYDLRQLAPEPRHMLVAIRSLALGALIRLSEPFTGSMIAHQGGLRAAEGVVDLLMQLTAEDHGTKAEAAAPLRDG